VTEREVPDGESSPDDSQPSAWPPFSTHLRPLPNPQPDKRLFATPVRPPKTRPPAPKPARPPAPAPKPTGPLPAERPTFPVAKPPPGIPARPPAPAPAEAKTGEPAPAEKPQAEPFDLAAALRRGSLFGYVVYLAFALGTFPLPGEVRFLLLWTLLIGMGATLQLFDPDRPLGAVEPVRLSWGLGIGFVLGLPLMLTASHALARTASALVPVASAPALFQALVLTWPLGETLFYRGAIQREHGLVIASLAAGLGNLLLYWPEADGVFAVLFVALIFATALAFVYSYVRLRYGLASAYACQVAANLMLIFLPRLLATGA